MEFLSPPGGASLAGYREYLRALARSRLGRLGWGGVDPSDVVQEALLRAHRAREQYRGHTEQELAAWLRTILSHTLSNALRAARRRHETASATLSGAADPSSVHPGPPPPADAGPPPEDLATRNEELVGLARALALLPREQRSVVEMKHLHGLSLAEICERTGRSKPSVVGLLFRGVRALRGHLGRPAPSGPGGPEGDGPTPAPDDPGRCSAEGP